MKKPLLNQEEREYLKDNTPESQTFLGACTRLAYSVSKIEQTLRKKFLVEFMKTIAFLTIAFSLFAVLSDFSENLELWELLGCSVLLILVLLFVSFTVDKMIDFLLEIIFKK